MKYKKYPSYKDSGVDWLTKIPEHWNLKKVKYLFRIRKRIAGKDGYQVLSITQNGIKVKDIESGEGQLSMDYSKYQFANKGDFAMNHMDLLTGYVDISKFNGVISPDYRVFTLEEEKANPTFYINILQTGYKNKVFYKLGQGSSQLGRWRLPTDQFNNMFFPYPPLSEQNEIAKFVSDVTQKVDTLIEKQEKLLGLLKEKRLAHVDNAIKREDTQKVRIVRAVNQISRPVIRKKNEEYISLGIYNRGRGLFHKPLKKEDELGESDFYWVENGDLILSGQFAWEGSVALATEQENSCIVSHRYPIIRGRKDILNTEYLWAYLTTREGDFLLNEHSVGSAGRNRPLNINTLLKDTIPVPNMESQLMISNIVKKERKLKVSIDKTIKLLKEKKVALISAAVTGKIDVRGIYE